MLEGQGGKRNKNTPNKLIVAWATTCLLQLTASPTPSKLTLHTSLQLQPLPSRCVWGVLRNYPLPTICDLTMAPSRP